MRFLQKLEQGLRIAAKLLLLAPLLMGMVWVNYTIDRSGLFAEPEATRTIATALLAGYDLAEYETMDERRLLQDYVEEMEEAPAVIALGSSRVLQLSSGILGTDDFFNCGMTGADFHDILGTYYLFDRAEKLPGTVILALDAWLFNPDENAYTVRSNTDLYLEFCALRLHIQNGYTPAEEEEPEPEPTHYEALFSPSYFQGNIAYWQQNRNTPEPDESEEDEFEDIDAPVVRGDIYSQNTEVKVADGSVIYTADFREANGEELESRARGQASTLNVMHGYDELDPELVEIFERFIGYVQGQGVNVILLLVPYHPLVYNYATEYSWMFGGLFAAEQYAAALSDAKGIPLYGSYNPYVVECTESDFFDGLHIKPDALSRVLPTLSEIQLAQRSGTAGSAWTRGDARVSYETAEASVIHRYGIEAPHFLARGEDKEVHGRPSYIVQRYDSEAMGTLLAQYAVTQDEGIVYRLDTSINGWVVDSRFG